MTAYAWNVEAGVATEIIAADEHRDELTVQLNAQAIHGADPVFLAFGTDAAANQGLALGNLGHTVRVLGAKARLAISAISAAVASGGIETHTSLEYRHVLNNPIWFFQDGGQEPPVALHFWPTPIWGEKWWEYTPLDFNPFGIMFDMNVQAGDGDIYLLDSDYGILETIAIGDAEIAGSIVTFTITYLLEEGATYFIMIRGGVIESTDGVPWAGSGVDWMFATAPGL